MNQIKSLLHVSIFIFSVIILSYACSESDSGTNIINDPLVGIWRLGSVTIISNDSILTTTDLGFTLGFVVGGGGEFSLSMQSDFNLLSYSGTWTSTATTLSISYSTGPNEVTDPAMSNALEFVEVVGHTITYPYNFAIDNDLEITTTFLYEGVAEPAIFTLYRP